MRGLAAKLGFKGVSLHSLRHTFATLMLTQNVHPKVVSQMLGHACVSVTLDIYSHPGLDLQRAAAQRLNDMLEQEPRMPKSQEAVANG